MGLNWTPCCFWLWWTTWRHPGRSCQNYVDDTKRVIWEGPKLPVVSIMAQKISLLCLLLFLLDAYLAVFLLSFKTFSVFLTLIIIHFLQQTLLPTTYLQIKRMATVIVKDDISLVCLLLFLLDAYLAVFLLSFKTFSVFLTLIIIHFLQQTLLPTTYLQIKRMATVIVKDDISLVCLLLFLLDAYLAVFLLSFKTFSVFLTLIIIHFLQQTLLPTTYLQIKRMATVIIKDNITY